MVRPILHPKYPDAHHDTYSRTVFGFWLYLMTDCVFFACIFAVYAVLNQGTIGGIGPKEVIDLPFVLVETVILLTSSFTIALGMLQVVYDNKKKLLGWFGATFLLGALFLTLQGVEMTRLLNAGNSWEKSGFLSAYFALLGSHGIHIFLGLVFMVVFMLQAMRRGLTPVVLTRLSCLRLFWLFLDLIWIVMFSYVYLIGAA